MSSILRRYRAATLPDLNDIRNNLETDVLSLGANDDVTGDLLLAVNEAVTNVIIHGYGGAPASLSLTIEPDGGDLIVRLVDEAPAFDPTQVPPPDLTLPFEDRPLGGLGVHMMRQLSDELIYRRTTAGENELTFVKRGVLAPTTMKGGRL